MILDVSTLTFAGGLVSLASGVFLLLHWLQTREDRAALISGAANGGAGIGVVIIALRASLPGWAAAILAPLFFCACSAGIWAAARIFNRGSIGGRPLIVAAGAGIAISMAAGAMGHDTIAAAVGLGISSSLFAAGALEFWLARGERLRGRWPMIALQVLQSIALLLAALEAGVAGEIAYQPSIRWLGMIHFVGLVYSGGSAIFLVTMLKGRSESKHRAAALTDPLTGLANRRAFMERAQSMLERNARDDGATALLAFDIDNFKRINDAFGHATGDRVLGILADVLARTARPADVPGRLGGDEFVLALSGCAIDAALTIAKRVRVAFQEDAQFVGAQPVDATVSVGVAAAPAHGSRLAEIIGSADSALYRAKQLGRNRVVLAAPIASDPDPVIRIA